MNYEYSRTPGLEQAQYEYDSVMPTECDRESDVDETRTYTPMVVTFQALVYVEDHLDKPRELKEALEVAQAFVDSVTDGNDILKFDCEGQWGPDCSRDKQQIERLSVNNVEPCNRPTLLRIKNEWRD